MPSVRCYACAKFLSSTEGVKCSNCSALYHKGCAALPPKGTIPIAWQCTVCKKTLKGKNVVAVARGGNDSSSCDEFQDSSPLQTTSAGELGMTDTGDMAAEFRLLKNNLCSEFRAMREDFLVVRADLSRISESLKEYNERLNALESRVATLERKPLVSHSSPDVEGLIAELRQDLNDRDQELLANDLEVSNLPEPTGENIIHTVKLLSSKLGVQLEDRDIVCADRVGGRHINATNSGGATQVRPRHIVIRLTRRELRDQLLSNARVRKGITSADMDMSGPARRVYLNERLTTQNRHLFRRARESAIQLGWQYVWTKRGRILARRKHGDAVHLIRSEGDLLRILGADTNDANKQVQ